MSQGFAGTHPDAVKLFDKLWERTIKRCLIREGKLQLTNEQSAEFITQKIGTFLRSFPFREQLHLSVDVKDNAKAVALLKKGNEYFHLTRVGGLSDLTKYYNESIAHAEKGSEDRAIAYANRSIVCLQIKRYRDCLENIRLARESNYPERLMEKLNRREAVAKDALLKLDSESSEEVEDVEELELSHTTHANVPQVVECLELCRNEKFGHHVVANRKLKAGDVVIIEKPFTTMENEYFRYLRCAHCNDHKSLTLIPCEGCTVTMYCSEECLSKAHQHYHRYECGILRDLWGICGELEKGVVGLRTVATAIALFDHDLEAMKEELEGLDESKVNAFAMDWRTATPKDIYNTVHVLPTNQALRNRKELSLQIFFATIIHQLMLERTELGAMCATSAENNKLLFDLILRHWQISQVNSVAMCYNAREEIEKLNRWKEPSRGVFSWISKLNHSCVPNVSRITLRDGRCAVVTIKPIAVGEQLFDSYDIFAYQQYASHRLCSLKRFYQFTCRCDACELEVDDGEYVDHEDIQVMRLVESMNKASIKVLLLKSYLNAARRYFPSYRLSIPQIALSFYLQYLHKTSTLGSLNLK